MKASVLTGIIHRLEAMVKSEGTDMEVRRFELDGVEKCQVIYHPQEEGFELKDSEQGVSYNFDNIDLVAIEIYELLA